MRFCFGPNAGAGENSGFSSADDGSAFVCLALSSGGIQTQQSVAQRGVGFGVMIVADVSIVHGAGLSFRQLGIPLLIWLLAGLLIPLFYFVGVILYDSNLLERGLSFRSGG